MRQLFKVTAVHEIGPYQPPNTRGAGASLEPDPAGGRLIAAALQDGVIVRVHAP